MTGETTLQPGGRAAAPGTLALVQAFINSHYDLEGEHGADLLRTADGLRAWLTDRGLLGPAIPVAAAELSRARAVRESLRALAGHRAAELPPDALHALNAAAAGATVELRFRADGPVFVAA